MVFNQVWLIDYVMINDPLRAAHGANLDGGTPIEGTVQK